MDYGYLTLVAPILTLAVAIATRKVPLAMLVGIFTGQLIICGWNPFAAINYIRKGIGYDEFCAEYADYRRIRADELYDVLDELQESARGYEDYDGWFAHIENYTRELERLYQSQEKQSESVALSTLHSAKGLEYENVYLIDVNEGVMPYKKAVLDQDIEEERRMFYVGMTRAKKYLHLFSVKQMNQKDADISRFIAEAGERLSPPCR